MTLPTVIILAVMTAYPLVFTVYYSFTNYVYGKKKGYSVIGLNNFITLLKTPYFQQAIWNTVKFTIIGVILEIVIGLLVAVFVNSLKRGQKVMRVLLLLPYLLPTVTVALAWKMMLSSNYGIVNQVLETFHIPSHNWFMEIGTAFNTIIVIDVWQNVPFVFLMLYAVLQGVSQDQYEAARIDGANRWQIFWKITIPNIKGGIALCALLRTIDTFRVFDKVNILTGGGPANSTATITQYLYTYGIRNLKFGLGSAGAIIMTILVMILSIPYIRRVVK